LSAHWDETVDPDHDCQVTSSNGVITMLVPGSAHDFAAELKRWNAPRVLSTVKGDFVLEAKISGKFDPGQEGTIEGRRPYNGAGLLSVQNNGNHLSLQRGAVRLGKRVRHYANFELRQDPDADVSNFEFDIEPTDVILRLARVGNKSLAMISQDGTNWRAFSPLTTSFPSTIAVGVEGINSSDTPFQCSFGNLALYHDQPLGSFGP
jgi:regulation of enolase protein 1 (concanavalin A-like superfamily)